MSLIVQRILIFIFTFLITAMVAFPFVGNRETEVTKPAVKTTLPMGLSLGKKQEGLLVIGATDAATAYGLNEGDKILEVENVPVGSVTKFRSAISAKKRGDTIAMVVQRGDATIKINRKFRGELEVPAAASDWTRVALAASAAPSRSVPRTPVNVISAPASSFAQGGPALQAPQRRIAAPPQASFAIPVLDAPQATATALAETEQFLASVPDATEQIVPVVEDVFEAVVAEQPRTIELPQVEGIADTRVNVPKSSPSRFADLVADAISTPEPPAAANFTLDSLSNEAAQFADATDSVTKVADDVAKEFGSKPFTSNRIQSTTTTHVSQPATTIETSETQPPFTGLEVVRSREEAISTVTKHVNDATANAEQTGSVVGDHAVSVMEGNAYPITCDTLQPLMNNTSFLPGSSFPTTRFESNFTQTAPIGSSIVSPTTTQPSVNGQFISSTSNFATTTRNVGVETEGVADGGAESSAAGNEHAESVVSAPSIMGAPMTTSAPCNCNVCTANSYAACNCNQSQHWTLNKMLYGDCPPVVSVGGWMSAGFHSESNDLFNDRPDELNLHQGWLFMEKSATSESPWGIRADFVYGIDGADTQAFGNNAGTFDFDNGFDHGSYAWALPQLYAEVLLGDWNIKAGHFFTVIGYEGVAAPGNFFYSHAMTMYNSEPFTHTGVLASREYNDWTVYAGWTLGWDTGFDQFNSGNNFLGGFSRDLMDGLSMTYLTTIGNFGARGDEGYSHSLVFNAELTDDLQYVLQSDLLRVKSTGEDNVGINQYLLYTLNDKWGVGARMEWWKGDVLTGYAPHGGVLPASGSLSYYAATFGANYQAKSNLVIRPEVRADWSPAADYDETYFGVDAIWTF